MSPLLGNIARATIVLFVFNLLSKVLGLVREMVIANQFGASSELDAYLVAYSIPTVLFALFNGALATVVVPVYSDYATREGEKEAWRLFATVFNVLLLLLAAGTLLGILLAPAVVKLLAPGFKGGTQLLAVELSRIMFPLLVFSGLAALFTGLLNARQIFAVTALNGPFSNLGVIAAVLLGGSAWGVRGMAWGLLLGGVAGAAVQVPALLRSGFRLRWVLDLNHPGLKKILKLVLPMAIGISISQTYILIDRILASGLAEGSISALNYANRLIQMPLGLFVTAVGTAFFPAFTQRAAEGNYAGLNDGLRRALRMVVLICLPAAVGLMVLREPLVVLFFGRGAFDARAVDMTSIALFFYSLGLVGQAAEFILVRGFYSLHDTATPVKLGAVAVLVNLVLSLILIHPLRHGGLALANSLAALTSMVLLVSFLERRLRGLWDRDMWSFLGRAGLAAAVMGAAVYAAVRGLGMEAVLLWGRAGLSAGAGLSSGAAQGAAAGAAAGSTLQALLQVSVGVGVGLLAYGLILTLLRLEEAQLFWAVLLRGAALVQGKLRKALQDALVGSKAR